MKRGRTFMLRPLGRLYVCSVLLAPTWATANVDEDRLLACIAQVETGARDLNRPVRKIGAAGERSAWQLSKDTWKLYTREAFTRASSNARLASTIARLHLRHLIIEIEAMRQQPTPQNLAIAWNAGLGALRRRSVPPGTYEYADRVANLYLDQDLK